MRTSYAQVHPHGVCTHGFGREYVVRDPGPMTRTTSRWGEHGPRPEPLPTNRELFARFSVSATVDVAASPESAWGLVTDITRIGEFSPECVRAEWLGGAVQPAQGARFEGTNRIELGPADDYVWIRPCTITAFEPPGRFSYVVGDRYD